MRYVDAGESHGPALTCIVCQVPAGLCLSEEAINADLARRQAGYGRGGRMKIETDTAKVLSGVRFSKTLGTPIAMVIENKDHANWQGRMDVFGQAPDDLKRETTPRPGHGDLVGALKIDTDDCRNILERASARATATRVAAGSVAKQLLAQLDVEVFSYVDTIGGVSLPEEPDPLALDPRAWEESPVRCPDEQTAQAMCARIDEARAAGDSLGGRITVVARGLVPGVGGYATGSSRLTSQVGAALFSIPAIKAVEFGVGVQAAHLPGSLVQDPIVCQDGHITRASNNLGGLEGGMANGQPLVIHVTMKPIPTLTSPLATVDLDTHQAALASKERSDVCAVPACGVVAEAEVALVLASAYQAKFGGDTVEDMKAALEAYLFRIS